MPVHTKGNKQLSNRFSLSLSLSLSKGASVERWHCAGLLIKESYIRVKIDYKIHVISPVCPRSNITLQVQKTPIILSLSLSLSLSRSLMYTRFLSSDQNHASKFSPCTKRQPIMKGVIIKHSPHLLVKMTIKLPSITEVSLYTQLDNGQVIKASLTTMLQPPSSLPSRLWSLTYAGSSPLHLAASLVRVSRWFCAFSQVERQ